MANTTIELRQSGSTGNTPSLGVLANGELAINRADGILYYKSSSNTLGSIRTTQPAGLTTEIQFNDAGSFGSNSGFTFNKTTGAVSVSGNVQLNSFSLLANTVTANSIIVLGRDLNAFANAAFNQANSVFLPSVTRLNVTNDGSSAYLIDQYAGNNPTIYINAGETIAFNLNVTGHPFMIRVSSGSTNYNTGLTHVASNGTVSTNASAQGQVTGTLYWKVPFELASNDYVYQCSIHGGMVGTIKIGQPNAVIFTHANSAFSSANAAISNANAAIALSQAAFDKANTPDAIANTANITAEAAFSKANAANVLAQAAYDFANTANIKVDAAFSKANAANVLAQAAYDFANTISGGSATDNVARSLAQAAFNQANTAIGDGLAFAIALG